MTQATEVGSHGRYFRILIGASHARKRHSNPPPSGPQNARRVHARDPGRPRWRQIKLKFSGYTTSRSDFLTKFFLPKFEKFRFRSQIRNSRLPFSQPTILSLASRSHSTRKIPLAWSARSNAVFANSRGTLNVSSNFSAAILFKVLLSSGMRICGCASGALSFTIAYVYAINLRRMRISSWVTVVTSVQSSTCAAFSTETTTSFL